jgi:hypothetical protein
LKEVNPMTHEHDEFCSRHITPAILNAHGFTCQQETVEKSMGQVIRIVEVEGPPFHEVLTRAVLTAGSPFRLCPPDGNFQASPPSEPDPETVAWFMSIRKESARRA